MDSPLISIDAFCQPTSWIPIFVTSELHHDSVQSYHKMYDWQKYPTQFAAQMYTAIQVVVYSLREIGNKMYDMSVEQRRKELLGQLRSKDVEHRKVFDTPIGSIWIDNDGEVHQDDSEIIVIELESGKEKWKKFSRKVRQ
jgi:hypothetical protein